jgi:alpha-L-fucosidase
MQERLLQIGDWMKINGEAIYGAARWKASSQWGPGKRGYKPANGGGDLLLKLTIDPDPGYAVQECFFTYNPERRNLYVILPKCPVYMPPSPQSNSFAFTVSVRDLTLPAHTTIELLDSHHPLVWRQQGKDVLITLPSFDPGVIKSQYAYVLKINNVSP